MEIETVTATIPLNRDNLPTCDLWEDDGSRWRAIQCSPHDVGVDWRWQPLNWIAFGKGEPTGEMTPVVFPKSFA